MSAAQSKSNLLLTGLVVSAVLNGMLALHSWQAGSRDSEQSKKITQLEADVRKELAKNYMQEEIFHEEKEGLRNHISLLEYQLALCKEGKPLVVPK